MNRSTVILIVLVAVLAALGMFFWGRASVHIPEPTEHKTDTVYVDLPPVYETIEVPVPAKEVPPDTVYYPVPQPADTAALFAVWLDYYTKREYNLDFSNDSLGVFKVNAIVNQNKLTQATSTVQPRVKVITNTNVIYKTKFIQPWAMVGTSVDFKFQQIQLGVDLNDKWMIGVSGIRYGENTGFTINGGVKF